MKVNRKNSWLSLLLTVATIQWSLGQQVRITATLDSVNYPVGDWIRIQLSAEHPFGTKILWNRPLVIHSPHFEKLNESGIDSIRQNDFLSENKIITVTSFDTGVLQIPPITCYYQQGEITDSIATVALAVYISSVAIDTAVAKPIKPPYEVVTPNENYRWYLLPVLSLIVIAIAGWYFLRKKTVGIPDELNENVDLRLPHQKAMDHLAMLEKNKPWENGDVKAYYMRITQILREYIETGLQLPALESTTHELMNVLKMQHFENRLLQQLQDDLRQADLVKFAKEQPGAAAHLHILNTVKNFVAQTIPQTDGKEEEALS